MTQDFAAGEAQWWRRKLAQGNKPVYAGHVAAPDQGEVPMVTLYDQTDGLPIPVRADREGDYLGKRQTVLQPVMVNGRAEMKRTVTDRPLYARTPPAEVRAPVGLATPSSPNRRGKRRRGRRGR